MIGSFWGEGGSQKNVVFICTIKVYSLQKGKINILLVNRTRANFCKFVKWKDFFLQSIVLFRFVYRCKFLGWTLTHKQSKLEKRFKRVRMYFLINEFKI